MARRLDMSGFSTAKLRRLLGSGDRAALDRIDRGLKTSFYEWPAAHSDARRILEAAIQRGAPFPDLENETVVHFKVAVAMALDEQDHLWTDAAYHGAECIELDLWRRARRYGSVETRTFVGGLVQGLPMFGATTPEGGPVYAAVRRDKLLAFLPGLEDLRDQILRREGDPEAATFATEFCGWIGEIADAGLDLWYTAQ
jgi:hypothetical protein